MKTIFLTSNLKPLLKPKLSFRQRDLFITPGRRQSKTPILSRNLDQNSLETEFSIAICRHTGDKWQSKTLVLSIFDPRSSIVDCVFDCCLPGVFILALLLTCICLVLLNKWHGTELQLKHSTPAIHSAFYNISQNSKIAFSHGKARI